MHIRAACLALIAFGHASAPAAEPPWPQFRGPNASGIAADGQPLPMEIGPEQNVIWKCPIPPGHSSPVLDGERVYLAGVSDERLSTIAIDRATGTTLWEAQAPYQQLEQVHQIGSHAQSSAATDGHRVVTFFGSSGLFCYDTEGSLLWQRPMGPFSNTYGAGSSPILVDDYVILCQDHDSDSFLMALDKRTGETVWRTDRPDFPRGYATPVIWNFEGKKQIVVGGTLRIVGYDFETGREIWSVGGVARIVATTPVVGDSGLLYFAAWSPGADQADRIQAPAFDELLDNGDDNANGLLERDEIRDLNVSTRFDQIDRDKDAHITREEYDYMLNIFETAENVVLAIKPGGRGDITDSHVAWKQKRSLPYVPSPLSYRGQVFLIKNGGILSVLDAKTGRYGKRGRVSGQGNYYSSPVAGDGKVYLLSQRGELSVISAKSEWRELAFAEFHEEAFATPALAKGRIYLRTSGHLYCFGLTDSAP